MMLDVLDFETEEVSQQDFLSDLLVANPREDIVLRVVRWQLAKRQAGTHKTKTRSEVSYSTKKIVRQKGSGGARHGSRGVVQFRHGGTTKGPVVRSHAHRLPKKVRKLGLVHALSSKANTNNIQILSNIDNSDIKTAQLDTKINKGKRQKTLIVTNQNTPESFCKSASNISNINLLSIDGLNVYDILNADRIFFVSETVETLKERLQ